MAAVQILQNLHEQQGLPVNQDFVESIIASQRPGPLQGLQKTVLFRVLNSDIQKTLQRNAKSTFPQHLLDGEKPGDVALDQNAIPVQVLIVFDMGRSAMEQLEDLEREERGEKKVGGRGEVIRVVESDEQQDQRGSNEQSESRGPHKLLLQDAAGMQVWGIEISKVRDISTTMSRGTKLLLKRPRINRGVVLLEPDTTSVLGGKIEALHQQWQANRKAELEARIRNRDG